jgi:hypothetical protein
LIVSFFNSSTWLKPSLSNHVFVSSIVRVSFLTALLLVRLKAFLLRLTEIYFVAFKNKIIRLMLCCFTFDCYNKSLGGYLLSKALRTDIKREGKLYLTGPN